MARKEVTKVKLSDLLGERKSNADLYAKDDDPERRKNHVRNRTPRHRLITNAAAMYQKSGAGDAKKDLLLNELAREYISNGMKKVPAVAAVFGIPLKKARKGNYMAIFDSAWFRSKVSLMMLGADGELAKNLPKEYALQKVLNMIEANILDYVDGDGRWLTVEEMRQLDPELQKLLDDFKMVNTKRMVALKDADGNVVRDENGHPHMVELREQQVMIKLPPKLKAMELLGKMMQWIQTHTEVNITHIDADLMMRAEARIKELRKDAEEIEGASERIASD